MSGKPPCLRCGHKWAAHRNGSLDVVGGDGAERREPVHPLGCRAVVGMVACDCKAYVKP